MTLRGVVSPLRCASSAGVCLAHHAELGRSLISARKSAILDESLQRLEGQQH